MYFTYGAHFCMNVVTGVEGTASAVLLRALRPTDGIELMARRRGREPHEIPRLTAGPGMLCRALGIALDHDGTDLSRGPITLELATEPVPEQSVSTGPRVGLREAAEHPWRFWITGDPTVSPYRPAAPLRRRRKAP